MARVEEIIQQVGSTEVLADAEPDDGLTSRSRRSAVKARKGLSHSQSTATFASTSEVTLEQITKSIRTLKNRRKQRHAQLRELMRDDEDVPWWGRGHNEAGGTPCPVCGQNVPGDEDVVEAHVDSCLAHLRITEVQASQSREADMEMDIDVEGGILAGVNFRGACEHLSGQCSVCDRMSIGTGFDIRDRTQQDVEDEVDVDGEDEVLFGAAQFTENDILAVSGQHESEDEDDDVDVGTGDIVETTKALKELLVEGKVVKRHVDDVKRAMDEVMGVGEAEEVEQAIERARKQNDQVALIQALENKVNLLASLRVSSSTSLLCRICLDPYTEPTASTGCWHTCCRECWLRCLGSTKMCPICKRITAAADLRRVYL
ncbi:hypothetical protein IEO21_05119 [Rhodonia placenta]|uniref:RING-type domain-containing protein n=1 Tax=Rhodonia placenta TaxID=104341 RepID=A0A8H7U1X0_9APHY|nr:hypothetical protein IEO21_05119 [Postia placenta]